MPVTINEHSADVLCPTCGKPVEGHKCRLCGATRTVNQVSGNVMWMRNGRLVAAFHDEKAAWQKAAQQHNIPKSEWPERFR